MCKLIGDAANSELVWEEEGEGKLLRAGNYTLSSEQVGDTPVKEGGGCRGEAALGARKNRLKE